MGFFHLTQTSSLGDHSHLLNSIGVDKRGTVVLYKMEEG